MHCSSVELLEMEGVVFVWIRFDVYALGNGFGVWRVGSVRVRTTSFAAC